MVRNYTILFAAVTMISFSVSYWVSHTSATPPCTHRAQVCNFAITPTKVCMNGILSTTSMLGDEVGALNVRSLGAHAPCGWIYQKGTILPWLSTGVVCGKGAIQDCW